MPNIYLQDLNNFSHIFSENFSEKHKKLKDIDDQQKGLILRLCESVVCAKDKNQWKRTILSCVKNAEKIEGLSTKEEVLEISAKHELADYPSAILYHSKKS